MERQTQAFAGHHGAGAYDVASLVLNSNQSAVQVHEGEVDSGESVEK